VAFEKSRRGLAAKVAVDALLVHVEFAAGVVLPLFVFCWPFPSESTGIHPAVKKSHGLMSFLKYHLRTPGLVFAGERHKFRARCYPTALICMANTPAAPRPRSSG
jgi:hypothetical protein